MLPAAPVTVTISRFAMSGRPLQSQLVPAVAVPRLPLDTLSVASAPGQPSPNRAPHPRGSTAYGAGVAYLARSSYSEDMSRTPSSPPPGGTGIGEARPCPSHIDEAVAHLTTTRICGRGRHRTIIPTRRSPGVGARDGDRRRRGTARCLLVRSLSLAADASTWSMPRPGRRPHHLTRRPRDEKHTWGGRAPRSWPPPCRPACSSLSASWSRGRPRMPALSPPVEAGPMLRWHHRLSNVVSLLILWRARREPQHEAAFLEVATMPGSLAVIVAAGGRMGLAGRAPTR